MTIWELREYCPHRPLLRNLLGYKFETTKRLEKFRPKDWEIAEGFIQCPRSTRQASCHMTADN